MAASDPLTQSPDNKWGELVVPLAVVGIVLMMVLPLPPFLVDFLLAVSLASAIGIFLIGLFMEEPLQFSAFPAVILISTLLRLALNVATTRLILLHGAEGGGAAGKVVETFGRFVVEGNVVVGLVVFFILVVINFVVITKGAGRVAEVAARFALDAMPGKQMAIDAELNSGTIDATTARKRRQDLSREMDFFGAMDGSSKFIKGDAIAGLLITGINLIGGLLIGISSGMDLGKAAETFSVLSVGEALVSQMPALMISTASGIVVTRSATGMQLGTAMRKQVLGSRRTIGATAGILTLMALVPGMPAIPFLLLASVLGYGAYTGKFEIKEPVVAASAPTSDSQPSPQDELEAALSLDVLTLEVGYELVQSVDPSMGGTVVDRIGALRKQSAAELGIVVPPIHIKDNLQLPPGDYRILLLGTEIARGSTRAGRLLALDSSGEMPDLSGESAKEPAFGTPAKWIVRGDKEFAEALGYIVVDHATVIATHLAEVVRRHAHQVLGRAGLTHLLEVFGKTTPKLVEELVPNLLSFAEVTTVMRNLLKEGVSIRDLRTILETLVELAPSSRDTEQLTEATRQRLSRQITSTYADSEGTLSPLVLDTPIEDMFRRSLREIAAGTGGALDPGVTRDLGNALELAVKNMERAGRRACLVTSPDLRRYVRAFAERRCPSLAVLSFREIEASSNIIPFEVVSATPRAA